MSDVLTSAMRAPDFWWQEKAAPARAMVPLGALYGAVAARRMARAGERLGIPVLCVGNFVVGGAGKTPTALALGQTLLARGETVFFLARGYRSAVAHVPRRVDLRRDWAGDVGDEALLLARLAPTIVGADRVASARLAQSQGAGVLILDDGLQNPALAKNLRLAVIDGATGFGNGLCLPAGPLRAPMAAQIAATDAAILIGPGEPGTAAVAAFNAAGKPVIHARLVPYPAVAAEIKGQRVYAFAGIGGPGKFYATLEEIGAQIVGRRDFADHHGFSAAEIQALQRQAAAAQAHLVTTEKDLARLAGRIDPALPAPRALPVSLAFFEPELLQPLIAAALSGCRFLS